MSRVAEQATPAWVDGWPALRRVFVAVAGMLLAVMVGCGAGGLCAAAGLPDGPPPLRLSGATRAASLSGHFGLLVDHDRALSFEDVRRADAEGRFVPRPDFRGVGQTRNIHWYRFDLLRDTGAAADWIMELGEAYIDHLDLYVPVPASDGGGAATDPPGFRRIRMGDFIPYSERPLRTRLHAAWLTLPEGRPVTVYLRVDSISAITLSGGLWSPAAFIAHQTAVLLFQGLFFGVLVILILGYLALGSLLRDGALLAYTGYVATVFVYYLFANGVAATILPDLPGWLMNLAVGSSGFIGVFATVAMWVRILDLRTNFPRLLPVYRGMSLLSLAAVPTAVTPLYSLANPVVMSIAMVVMLLSFALTVVLIRRDRSDVSLRFYLASTITSMAGILVAQLALRGGLPVDFAFADPYQLASVLAVSILGFGLALRIRRLQTERLRAQQETAFATKRAEEQRTFVVMLSHEFRTPLASIDSAVQMIALTGGLQEPATAKRLERVRATTRKLADLVEMFLSSDALDQGALALRPERVPLGRLLESALDGLTSTGLMATGLMATGLAGEAETRVILAVDAPERPVHADVQFLGVAVGNLVQNALRYSPPDTPVTVTTRVEAGGVAISIADRGRGMSPEEVERIGSIYFRAASSAGTKGMGIGLYMTQKIIAAHGGTLGVDSVAGKGSVFTIRLRDDGLSPRPSAIR